MEFLDDYESRPRFLFQSKNTHQPSASDHHPQPSSPSSAAAFFSSLHKPTLFLSIFISLLLSTLAFLYANFEPLKSILFWVSFSLLLGPFAPPSLTAGDIRVGIGPPINDEDLDNPIQSNEKLPRKSTKVRKKIPEDAEGLGFSTSNDGWVVESTAASKATNRSQESVNGKGSEEKSQEEGVWAEADYESLRKLMVKHPVGKPGRWEAIAEGFKGKFKVDTVISKSKEMGERKVSNQDSYKKFLKDRKPVDKSLVDEGGEEINAEIGNENQNVEAGNKESGWSSIDDLALLNALKAFPKDVAMRWDKIAASVPGKTKAACIKRLTELKKDFRSSKASSGQALS